MNAPVVGGMLLGGLIGGGLAWGSAALWAKGKVLATEDRHEAELNRLATVNRMREAAILRGVYPDEAESNAWELLREAHDTKAHVLPMRQPKKS